VVRIQVSSWAFTEEPREERDTASRRLKKLLHVSPHASVRVFTSITSITTISTCLHLYYHHHHLHIGVMREIWMHKLDKGIVKYSPWGVKTKVVSDEKGRFLLRSTAPKKHHCSLNATLTLFFFVVTLGFVLDEPRDRVV